RVDPQPQRLRADRERQTGALALLLALLGMSSAADAQDFAAQRARLVAEVEAMYAETSRETGMSAMSAAVRASLGKVERHRFVPKAQQSMAYRNQPLPIGGGHTISQPYIVALSTDLLQQIGRASCRERVE